MMMMMFTLVNQDTTPQWRSQSNRATNKVERETIIKDDTHKQLALLLVGCERIDNVFVGRIEQCLGAEGEAYEHPKGSIASERV